MTTINVHDWRWMDVQSRQRGPLPLIPIHALDQLHEHCPLPLYVIVMGGIATGKSHVVREHVKSYKVADIDDYMVRHGYDDYARDGKQFRQVMSEISTDIERYKMDRVNMLSMGTGADFNFLAFRLEEARADGYETAILHVHAPHEQALIQNAQRKARGDHHVSDAELDRIVETIQASAGSLQKVLNDVPDLLGYLCVHSNARVS